MNNYEINRLLSITPIDPPYESRVQATMQRYSRYPSWPSGTRLFAFVDPAFGAHFATIMAEHRRPLPEWLEPGPLREYADALQSGEPFSPAVSEAVRLGCSCFAVRNTHPIWRDVNLVRLCLLTEGLSLEAISQRTGVSVAGLNAYNELFLNIRGREKTRDYLAGLLHLEIKAGPLFPNHPLRRLHYEALTQDCLNNVEDFWAVSKIILRNGPTLEELGFSIVPTEYSLCE